MPDIVSATKTLRMPVECDPSTDTIGENRREWCLSRWEALRLEHNANGQDYRSGTITRSEFDSYRRDVFRPIEKALLNIVAQISDSTGDNRLDIDSGEDRPRIIALAAQDQLFKESTRWSVNLETDVI